MNIKIIESVSPLAKRYDTGEQPVLLDCSDGNSYVCKYGSSSCCRGASWPWRKEYPPAQSGCWDSLPATDGSMMRWRREEERG